MSLTQFLSKTAAEKHGKAHTELPSVFQAAPLPKPADLPAVSKPAPKPVDVEDQLKKRIEDRKKALFDIASVRPPKKSEVQADGKRRSNVKGPAPDPSRKPAPGGITFGKKGKPKHMARKLAQQKEAEMAEKKHKSSKADDSDESSAEEKRKSKKRKRDEVEDSDSEDGSNSDSDSGMDNPDLTPEERKRLLSLKKRAEIKDREGESYRTIFVGNVPVTCKNKQLKAFFKEFGEVESVRFRNITLKNVGDNNKRKFEWMHKELHEGRSTMNAYVVFKKERHANKALAANGTVFQEHHLRVDLAANSGRHNDQTNTVHVRNLPLGAEEEDLWEIFGQCGEVANIRIIRDEFYKVAMGYAYVKFRNDAATQRALLMNEKVEYKEQLLKVSLATEQQNDVAEFRKKRKNYQFKQRRDKVKAAGGSKSANDKFFGQDKKKSATPKSKENSEAKKLENKYKHRAKRRKLN